MRTRTATRSGGTVPLFELPSLPAALLVLYRWPKLLLYRRAPVRGEESLGVPLMPSAEANDRLSPILEGPPKLEGAMGGEGLASATGDAGRRWVAPAPMGDGSAGARDEVGELCTGGRDGNEGPAGIGACCL